MGTGTTVNSVTPSGTVLDQNPVAATILAQGSAVNLMVSSGPVTVPDVVGRLQAQAATTLTSAGLVLGTVTQVNSAAPATEVLAQSPAAGTPVAPNSAVDLQVSSGPVTVPNVVGLTQAAATATFAKMGFGVVAVTTATSATVPLGQVLSQTPAAGTSVAPGSPVSLVVSAGSCEQSCKKESRGPGDLPPGQCRAKSP